MIIHLNPLLYILIGYIICSFIALAIEFWLQWRQASGWDKEMMGLALQMGPFYLGFALIMSLFTVVDTVIRRFSHDQ